MKTLLLGAALAALVAMPAHGQSASSPAKPDKVAVCAECHGEDGNSPNPQQPIIAQQNARYIFLQLKDFKEGRRKDPDMSRVAATLDTKDMLALADWFSKQKAKPTGFRADPAKVDAGRKVADAVLCAMCHGGNFSGQNEVPREAGQHYAYIKKQLGDFKAKRRTNDAGNMASVTSTLSDEQIDDLANFIANLD